MDTLPRTFEMLFLYFAHHSFDQKKILIITNNNESNEQEHENIIEIDENILNQILNCINEWCSKQNHKNKETKLNGIIENMLKLIKKCETIKVKKNKK